jgi:hypothetical protein
MAWTDYYVDSAATGTGTGLSAVNAWTTISAAISGIGAGPASGSTRINIKVNASPYAQTSSSLTFNTAGATTAPVWWRGYKSTIGDQDGNNVAVANTDIPQITFTTGQMIISGTIQIFSNIDISSACTSTGGAVNISVANGHIVMYGVRIANTAANSASRALTIGGASCEMARCWFKATTTAAICVDNTASDGLLVGCVINGGIIGFSAASTRAALYRCIFDGQTGDSLSGSSSILTAGGCIFYGGNGPSTGNAIVLTPGSLYAFNNYMEHYTSASKAGINNSSGTNTAQITAISNSFYNMTANYAGMGDFPPIFDNGTLASSGLTLPGSANFTPTSVLYSLGFPGKFETVSLYQGYLDGGAIQHLGASGAVYVPIPYQIGF